MLFAVAALVTLAGPSRAAVEASCSLSATRAEPGAAMTADVDHVAPGTQVTLTFDHGALADAVAGTTGRATVTWRVPADVRAGVHSVVLVGQGVYCDAIAFRVGASGSSSGAAPAEGTVGAAGRSPSTRTVPGGDGTNVVMVAVAGAVAGLAAIGAGLQALRVLRRRRHLAH